MSWIMLMNWDYYTLKNRGGNQYPISHFNDNNKQSKFYFAYRNEKLARMIKRDRNHPSLVIYNLHNERGSLATGTGLCADAYGIRWILPVS